MQVPYAMAVNNNVNTSRPAIEAVYSANFPSILHKMEEILRVAKESGHDKTIRVRVHYSSRVSQKMIDDLARILK